MTTARIGWFATHELRLAWRDLAAVVKGGSARRRPFATGLGLLAALAFVHFVVYRIVAGPVREGIEPGLATFTIVGGAILLTWCLIVSQAIESVTRAFYARGDLDLILSSPARTEGLFAVRIAAVAGSGALLAMLLASPIVHVLVAIDGPRWLAIHGVAIAMGASGGAVAVTVTALLFRLVGPAWTRSTAQVVAAIVGAAFAISLQAFAIVTWGGASRFAALTSRAFDASLPHADHPAWLPARAAIGDPAALAAVLALSLVLIVLAMAFVAPRFAGLALSAAGAASRASAEDSRPRPFRTGSAARALREKEWRLLRRDPWLLSQTLMQILYLLPAVLLLWRSFGDRTGVLPILVPVLVMAAGQLAGGLAWLAVSGEDAPDLVGTAPIRPFALTRAKVEAVLGAVGIAVAPLLFGLALVSPAVALLAAAGIAAASASATAIQLWFRARGRRSNFRRRQTSSRLATFAEAFSSILWACSAGFAAGGEWLYAAVAAAVCVAVLIGVRATAPGRA